MAAGSSTVLIDRTLSVTLTFVFSRHAGNRRVHLRIERLQADQAIDDIADRPGHERVPRQQLGFHGNQPALVGHEQRRLFRVADNIRIPVVVIVGKRTRAHAGLDKLLVGRQYKQRIVVCLGADNATVAVDHRAQSLLVGGRNDFSVDGKREESAVLQRIPTVCAVRRIFIPEQEIIPAAMAAFLEVSLASRMGKNGVAKLVADGALDHNDGAVACIGKRRDPIDFVVDVDTEFAVDFDEHFVFEPAIQFAARLARSHLFEIGVEIPDRALWQVVSIQVSDDRERQECQAAAEKQYAQMGHEISSGLCCL